MKIHQVKELVDYCIHQMMFSSTAAAYTFGSVRYMEVRGYDSENTAIFFNGVDNERLENGSANYSDWGGLNDALRNKESYAGQDNNNFSQSIFRWRSKYYLLEHLNIVQE